MSVHICDALIISCIDFRFQRYLQKWLQKNFADKTYDYVGYAGGSKDLLTIIKQLDISVRLHHINQVVLIHHEDCGAYGKESTHENHVKDLKKAKQTMSALYPHLQIDSYYLHLDGEFEKI